MRTADLKYMLGAILALPALPIMYLEGKRIYKVTPRLPEAEGVEGVAAVDSAAKSPLQLVTMGESTVAGVGVSTHEEGFSGTMASELAQLQQRSIHWRVYARSGYTAERLSQKLVSKITEKPDLLVIALGGNDAFNLHSPWRWRKDMQGLIDRLRERFPDAPIVFCNMPPIKEFPAFSFILKGIIGNLVELLGTELAALVRDQENVYYFGEKITLKGWMRKFQIQADRSVFFSDGVHPSKLTYQTWAKDVARNISQETGLLD